MTFDNMEKQMGALLRQSLFLGGVLVCAALLAMTGCRSIPVSPAGVIDQETASVPEFPAEASPLAARVNGEPLTYDALVRQFDLYFIMSGDAGVSKQNVRLGAFLQRYLLEMLLLQEVRDSGFQAVPGQSGEAVASYLKQADLTMAELSENLNRLGLEMADAERFVENKRRIDQWSRKKFEKIPVSDEEVRAFYDDNPDYFHIPESITVSQIRVCHEESPECESGRTKQEARTLADHLQKIATPENFAGLAQANASDPTATGGRPETLFRGFSSSEIEAAAFSLKEDEISDVVETASGYTILLVTERREARVTPFESVREMIRENLLTSRIQSAVLAYAMQLKEAAEITLFDVEGGGGAPAETDVPGDSGAPPLSESPFQTFKETGRDRCTEGSTRPLILLFSAASCSHCEWVGEAFDAVVQAYVERGLVDAHHYDIETGDDLLTPEVESGIPEAHRLIGKAGDPDGYLPYFSFGCRYDRIGTGYEEQDDLAAEAEEMRLVIDALLP